MCLGRTTGIRRSELWHTAVLLGQVAIEDAEAALPEIPRRTLQRDLRVLVEKQLAVAEGAVRARRYRLKDKRLR